MDLWNLDLGHFLIALALLYLARILTIYKTMVIVAESSQVCTLMALEGPSSIPMLPEPGETPSDNLLGAVDTRWRSFADESWWTMQGRIVISQYAPGNFALLGDGGAAKYDPALEIDVIRCQVRPRLGPAESDVIRLLCSPSPTNLPSLLSPRQLSTRVSTGGPSPLTSMASLSCAT